MKQVIYSILLLLPVLQGCKPETPAEPPLKHVTKIANAENEFRSFEYNSQQQLTGFVSQFVNGSGVARMVTTYHYENGILAAAQTQNGVMEYTITGGRVRSTRFLLHNGVLRTSLTFSYNSKGQLQEWTELTNNPQIDQPVETKLTYEYFADGNLKKTESFFRYRLDEPFVSMGGNLYDAYDQHRNPEFLFAVPFYLPGVVNKNNPHRIRQYAPNGDIQHTITFEYTYDADRYPITKRMFDSRSSVSILFNYTY